LLALRARLHFKRDLLVLLQRLEAFRADFREMREQIFAAAVSEDTMNENPLLLQYPEPFRKLISKLSFQFYLSLQNL